jgi:hypothetical protein
MGLPNGNIEFSDTDLERQALSRDMKTQTMRGCAMRLRLKCFMLMLMTPLCTAVGAQSGGKPVAQWLFQAESVNTQAVLDQVNESPAQFAHPFALAQNPMSALECKDDSTVLRVADPSPSMLPSQAISLESWVNLSAGIRWGGILGYFQDNGDDEKGWLLGYDDSRFNVSVSVASKLQYLTAQTRYRLGQWYHVVGTYDGQALKLYVNGKLENSLALQGPIDYPDQATLTMAAYLDANERNAMQGLIHEVSIYDQALDPATIRRRHQAKRVHFARPLELDLGPYVQYVTPLSARIHWWTHDACASIIEYGLAGPGAKHSPGIELKGKHQGKLDLRVEDRQPKRRHSLTISGLRPNEVYAYRVGGSGPDSDQATPVYELDTALNYAPRPLRPAAEPFKTSSHGSQVKALAREILNKTGIDKGYCLVWGVHNGQLAYELAAQSQLTVLGIDEDASRIREVTQTLYKAGAYGARIMMQQVPSMKEVPFPSHFANLIVSERALAQAACPGSARELQRVLQPGQGIAVLGSLANRPGALSAWLAPVSDHCQSQDFAQGSFYALKKPTLPGAGSWTHQYGDVGNTAHSHEELAGASATDHLALQWIGHPGADFGVDRNPRMPAPLAVSGRLFHQGMNRMVAVDSYNGAVLWSLEIPDLHRMNLPRDAGNWCTDESSLYVAIKDHCWVIDHRTGALKQVFRLPAGATDEKLDWGYVAHANGVLFGSTVKRGTAYTDFWGGASWYDKTSGAGTGKVCSDMLFAYDLESASLLWQYERGVAINTTLAAGSGRLYFVESRNPEIKQQAQRRISDAGLWAEQFLVALDERSGEVQWEVPIDTVDGTVVFFLGCTDKTILLSSSAQGKYHLYAFNADTGRQVWKNEHKWPSDNHSGHMQHAVLFETKLYLEPCGYDLATGEQFTSAVGRHEGCATYCGINNALLYRGKSRRISLWDVKSNKVTSWHNLRPSCWLSTIAADGMVILPEGGGGCSCGNWLETSLAFSPVARGIDAGTPTSK